MRFRCLHFSMKNRTLLSVNLSVSATENPVSMHTACKRNEMLDIIPFSWGPMNTGHRHEKVFIRTHWWYANKNVGDMIYYGYWLLVMWPTMAIDYWWCDLLWLLITSDIIYCGYWLPVIWSTVGIQITISVQESSSATVRPVSTVMGMNHWARTSLSVIICWDENMYYTICYIYITLFFFPAPYFL